MKFIVFAIASFLIGTLFISMAIFSFIYIPLQISHRALKDIHLGFDDNGTYNIMTKRWIEPKYSMKLNIWVFSLKNPLDVVKSGSRPIYYEKGPYVFDEHQLKVKLDFMDNNTKILYRNKHTYFFNRRASCKTCDLQDTVTIPNIVFQSIIDIASNNSPVLRELIERVLLNFRRETPFITVTVEEMLFKGYEDPLISSVCNMSFIKPFCIAADIPLRVKFMENGTDDGEFLIDTGLNDAHDIGMIYAWNGKNETPWWFTKEARMINGTDGSLYSPGLSRFKNLQIFLGQLGRSYDLKFDKSVSYDNVPCYRFIFPSNTYDPFRVDNQGFCDPVTPKYFNNSIQPNGCLPAGIYDIGHTKPSSPRIYFSGAHFYGSPKVLYEKFIGFVPPSDDNDSYFDLEPYTGAVVDVLQTYQINVGLIPGKLRMLSGMESMILPVFWASEVVSIDADTRNDLMEVVNSSRTSSVIGLIFLVFGILLWVTFIIALLLKVFWKKKRDDQEHLIEEESES